MMMSESRLCLINLNCGGSSIWKEVRAAVVVVVNTRSAVTTPDDQTTVSVVEVDALRDNNYVGQTNKLFRTFV